MVNQLDDCTPHDLHLEIRSLDCTQERAHELRRYAYKCYEEAEEAEAGVDAEAWYKLVSKIEALWGDYESWHTYDRKR